ncbi:MAG TPA: hypothetical protein EYN66_17445 [Myxococcales bacterium]|nr:hypothetical protein [Myxococcales bacterium]
MPRFSDYLRRGFGRGADRRLLIWRKGSAAVSNEGPRVEVSGRFNLLGGLRVNHVNVSVANSPYTAQGRDYLISVDSSKGPVDVQLPLASVAGSGSLLVIKDVAGFAGVNSITIRPVVGESIEGASALVITYAYAGNQLYSDGLSWYIFGAAQ